MISINLNAIKEWERIRRDTEPETPDVDRNPGTEDADAPGLENGSNGRRVQNRRRRRNEAESESGEDNRNRTDAYEVDLGDHDDGLAPPPDGERAPLEEYQATRVDIET